MRVQPDDVLLPSAAAIEDVAWTIRYAGLTPSPEVLAKIAKFGHVRPLLSPTPWDRRGQTKLLSFARWPVGTTPSEATLHHAVLTAYLAASCRSCGSRWHTLVVNFDLVARQPASCRAIVSELCPRCRNSLGQVVTDLFGPAPP